MTELRVPPGCTGLQMAQGGEPYKASRSGSVTVDDPRHVRQILKASEASGGPISLAIYGAPVGVPSRHCPACAFIGYGWQADCPKGHGPMRPGRPPRTTKAPAS